MGKYRLFDAITEYFAIRKKLILCRPNWCLCLLWLFFILVVKTLIGGQKIGEANSDDIGLWCHLYWCSRSDQKEAEGTRCHIWWFRALWLFLLCCQGRGRVLPPSFWVLLWIKCLNEWSSIYKVCNIMCEQMTLEALGEMFVAAREIMNWLSDCAKVSSFLSIFL